MRSSSIPIVVVLLGLIYILPMLRTVVQADGAIDAIKDGIAVVENESLSEDEQMAAADAAGEELTEIVVYGGGWFWVGEALSYCALIVVVAMYAVGQKVLPVTLLVVAAVFDIVPILNLVPLVPTVLFIIVFTALAKDKRRLAG